MRRLTKEELEKIYESVGEFYEGLVRARKNGTCFYIYPDGTPAYQEKYDYVGDFHEGLATALKGRKLFHIRRDGMPAYKQRYDCMIFTTG